MNSQEIKDGMTIGEWGTKTRYVITTRVCAVRSLSTNESIARDVWTTDAEAICLAVNNTFGAQIDPAKVPEIVKMLDALIPFLMPAQANVVADLLNSAKLK